MSEDQDLTNSQYAIRVGERIRAIRQQKDMSLQEVEHHSDGEFKASVLGAYERGERSISVLRIQRLAKFYGTTVDQILPSDPLGAGKNQQGTASTAKLRIDVAKLSFREGERFRMLERFLRMIQIQRQDFNGKVITIRSHDTRAIAVMIDVPIDDVGTKLAELDLLFLPPTT